MMTTKRLLAGLFMAVCFAQTAVSIPADPKVRKIRQADGSLVSITVRGDEHGHMAFTEDNHPLFLNVATGNYEYATIKDGAICGSGIIAANADKRKTEANAFLNSQDVTSIMAAFKSERSSRLALRNGRNSAGNNAKGVMRQASSGPKRLLIRDFPTIGEQHSLVILVSFSDKAFKLGTGTHTFYNDLLNKEGFTYSNGANGSARDFYIDCSNGLFKPTFDVVGPVALTKSYSYYGANTSGSDDMDRLHDFVYDACTLADSLVDFSKYDTNGDGYVDNIYFIYAGGGEADGGGTSTIWPHSYTYEEFGKGSLMLDSMYINSYACGNEIRGYSGGQLTGIGTFVHEFGHVLGLMDHYDTYSGSSFTPGNFDTMDQGSYNNNMNTPPTFSAFERGELGWLEYTELTDSTDTISTLPDLKDCNMAYRVSVKDNPNEFYVLENRQKKGWDAYLPGHGMLMWHIDIDNEAWTLNRVNTNSSHQRVDLVEADNHRSSTSTAGDPFPGVSNVTNWTIQSWANDTLLCLDDIYENDSLIELTLAGMKLNMASPALTVTDVQDSVLTVAWDNVPYANHYTLSMYRVEGDSSSVVSDFDNKDFSAADTITIDNLTPDTDYELLMCAKRGSYLSDTVTVKVATTPIPFVKFQPQGVAADDITSHGFNATWQDVTDADTYEVTLTEHSFSEETTSEGYDFTNRASGMPDSWQFCGSFISSDSFCGKSAPAFRMTKNADFLTVVYPETRMSSLSFWIKATTYTEGTMRVENHADGAWQAVDSLVFAQGSSMNNIGMSRNYSFAMSDSVRLRFERTAGALYLDDVHVGCHKETRTPIATYNCKETSGLSSYTFSGLEPGKTYGLTVRASKNGELTWPSAELLVTLPDGSAGIEMTETVEADSATVIYDLSGRRMADGNLPHGVYVVRKGGKSIKVIRK